jgi:glycosyltransferase involved in cell wall biosynthesis
MLCDIFVLPGLASLSINQAMYYGKPVICAKRGFEYEVIEDNESGVLIEPQNMSQLISAILKLLLDDDLRKKMGARGKEIGSMFSIDTMVRGIVDAVEFAVKSGR